MPASPAAPPAAARVAPPPAPAPAAAAGAPPAADPEIEFDGGATDVADVALADFPVLTDAVEPPAAKAAEPPAVKPAEAPAVKPTPAGAAKATPAPQASAPPAKAAAAATAPGAAKPSPKTATRVEPAQAAPPAKPTSAKPAPSSSARPTTTPLPHAAAAKAAAAGASASRRLEPDDQLRQTQTVRAIADAKSLDDLSDIDAETLFGDAELDLVSAALASAAEWPDDEEPTATPAPPVPTGKKTAAPSEEALDLFGLDDNAPLELIDDATLPPANPTRKSASR